MSAAGTSSLNVAQQLQLIVHRCTFACLTCADQNDQANHQTPTTMAHQNVQQRTLANLTAFPNIHQNLLLVRQNRATMGQLLTDRPRWGYAGGRCRYDYVVNATDQRLDLAWVCSGVLRQELGISAANWSAWRYGRDNGCLVVYVAGNGTFAPGLLRRLGGGRFSIWRGPGLAGVVVRREYPVGVVAATAAATAPAAPAAAPVLASLPVLAAAALAVLAAATGGEDDDDGDDDDEEDEDDGDGEEEGIKGERDDEDEDNEDLPGMGE